MGARRIRRDQRQFDMALSRRVNGLVKMKERDRRDKRMVELVKTGKFPFTPSIRSWISQKLDIPSTRITEADVSKLVSSLK